MSKKLFRIEQDSMGEVRVPQDALYGAQTQRAVENFPISGLVMPQVFINAVALIKKIAARVNVDLGILDAGKGQAIAEAAEVVISGEHCDQFPVDVFQTGSGTSTNMNVNEVIASLATENSGLTIHPNDDVNCGQSSNDVIPTTIHVSAALACYHQLLPALQQLKKYIDTKANDLQHVTKTGRTHLMDAMPLTMSQELSAWSAQIAHGIERIDAAMVRLCSLAQGGTAVGTGINAHPEFAPQFASLLSEQTGVSFKVNACLFEGLATQDAAVELSGQLKVIAVSLMKISNDLRWMNSGPLSGLGEIELKALQPGSSIMPGKVNPVIAEAVAMVAAQVIGNDSTITIAGQSGLFQLNVMLPVIAYNLLQSIELLSNAAEVLAEKAVATFTVKYDKLNENLSKNPILVTALNPIIGYQKAAEIAKKAYKEGRPIIDVASEMTSISRQELEELLNPIILTGES